MEIIYYMCSSIAEIDSTSCGIDWIFKNKG